MNLLKIAKTAFKTTLEASPEYRALVAHPDHPTIYRTFGEYVHPSIPLPYVTIEWYAGGMENNAKSEASRSLWKIVAHTEENEALADQIAAAIEAALHLKMPQMGSITAYAGYAPILLVFPFQDTVVRQSRSILRMGGIYQLSIAEVQS